MEPIIDFKIKICKLIHILAQTLHLNHKMLFLHEINSEIIKNCKFIYFLILVTLMLFENFYLWILQQKCFII